MVVCEEGETGGSGWSQLLASAEDTPRLPWPVASHGAASVGDNRERQPLGVLLSFK